MPASHGTGAVIREIAFAVAILLTLVPAINRCHRSIRGGNIRTTTICIMIAVVCIFLAPRGAAQNGSLRSSTGFIFMPASRGTGAVIHEIAFAVAILFTLLSAIGRRHR